MVRIGMIRSSRGMSLIELLVALGVAGILAGVIIFTLKVLFDTYQFAQDDIFLQKFLNEALQDVADGGYDSYGVKDSLEIASASERSITFVPLWVDDTHIVDSMKTPPYRFILNKPFKAGASFPIAEISARDRKSSRWKQVPIIFSFGQKSDSRELDDTASVFEPVPAGSRVRFIYQPETAQAPECAMTIAFAKDMLVRTYTSTQETIPRLSTRTIKVQELRFQYYDNSSMEIIPGRDRALARDLLPLITAVKTSMKVVKGKTSKEGSVFVNIRNTRASGKGLIIQKGTRLKIPDSLHIRTFSLGNIVGFKEGDSIVLEARSQGGRNWRVSVTLGIKDARPVIAQYSIEYPAGLAVYSETINLTTDLPLNFLTLGGNGRYDYDVDPDTVNIVDLEGDVELQVLEMDAAGAALFIRP